MNEGIVIQTTGSWHQVKLKDGRIIQARLIGKLRLNELKLTNPVAVGDRVIIGNEEDEESMVIQEILERKNQIIRQSPRKKRHYHIIASNVDQALIICSMKMPRTKLGFISRLLASSEYYEIKPIVIFNKTDLHQKKDEKKLAGIEKDLKLIGYKSIRTSVEDGNGLEQIKELTMGKLSVLTGPSGVGKSSLINYLNPGLDLKTNPVSNYNEKGQHTTTFGAMHELEYGGFIIDTPGIKEYALAQIDAYELSFYFPEMKKVMDGCQFNNCQHINEPKCAVLEALEGGAIPKWRYNSYVQIREELFIENKHYL